MFYWCISFIFCRLSLFPLSFLLLLCWTDRLLLPKESYLDLSLSSFYFFYFSNRIKDWFSLYRLRSYCLSFYTVCEKVALKSSNSDYFTLIDSLNSRISRCNISSLLEWSEPLLFSTALSKYWFSILSYLFSSRREVSLFSYVFI